MIPVTQMASISSGALAPVMPLDPFISAVGGGVGQAVMTGIDSAGFVPAPASMTVPFGDLLTEAVGQVDLLERQARSSVEGLMSGTGVDVHEAMITTEKAEMGFELVLSVRNKALSAYQQVMGMQF
ncbi:flagellar hook-basal body complex protein FliE [Acidicapsa ligni]|uniref:flagellar hook-basal body complex protein FliE n=1 Tax=Acidicapsa ligni TaxID=542300 RepID=UPI0021E0FB29|nr:flagellar hook-basal body complex protein FliE [Acidicapsa ligni]